MAVGAALILRCIPFSKGTPYWLNPCQSLKGKRVEKLPPPQKVAVDFIEDGFLANAGSLIPYCRELLFSQRGGTGMRK